MAELIKHEGIIDTIQGTCIQVRIVQASACSACGAKSLCKSAESKEKIIDIYDADVNAFKVGQRVMVEGRASLGMKAVRLAFLIPLVLLFVTLFVVYALTDSEVWAGAAALIVLLPYYIVLYFMRKRLSTEFSFRIKSI